jgi:hypothetical protein
VNVLKQWDDVGRGKLKPVPVPWIELEATLGFPGEKPASNQLPELLYGQHTSTLYNNIMARKIIYRYKTVSLPAV